MKIKTLPFAILLLCAMSSCKSYRLEKEYKEKWEKYRTFMYRSNFKQCFVDSSRKYGSLYSEIMGWGPTDVNTVDTITVNAPAVCE
jgi:hypothetical protein